MTFHCISHKTISFFPVWWIMINDEPFSISELLYNTSCQGKCLQSISVVILFITPKSQADDIDFYGKCRET